MCTACCYITCLGGRLCFRLSYLHWLCTCQKFLRRYSMSLEYRDIYFSEKCVEGYFPSTGLSYEISTCCEQCDWCEDLLQIRNNSVSRLNWNARTALLAWRQFRNRPLYSSVFVHAFPSHSYVYTHSFFHSFGAYAPSVHAESQLNAQPAETPGARSLPTCPACRSELAWHSHGQSNTSVETVFALSSRAVKSV
jgi:hypothetical protein